VTQSNPRAPVSIEAPPSQWPRAAASAAVFRDGHVLLVERGKGTGRGLWSLPGGHVEPGEPARDAARREVLEETCVTVDLRGLVDVVDVIAREPDGALKAHYILSVYFGAWAAGEPSAQSDAAQAQFVALGDLGAYRLTERTEGVIRRAAKLFDNHGRSGCGS
jgi:8-oxo-dGTP diphosphatase